MKVNEATLLHIIKNENKEDVIDYALTRKQNGSLLKDNPYTNIDHAIKFINYYCPSQETNRVKIEKENSDLLIIYKNSLENGNIKESTVLIEKIEHQYPSMITGREEYYLDKLRSLFDERFIHDSKVEYVLRTLMNEEVKEPLIKRAEPKDYESCWDIYLIKDGIPIFPYMILDGKNTSQSNYYINGLLIMKEDNMKCKEGIPCSEDKCIGKECAANYHVLMGGLTNALNSLSRDYNIKHLTRKDRIIMFENVKQEHNSYNIILEVINKSKNKATLDNKLEFSYEEVLFGFERYAINEIKNALNDYLGKEENITEFQALINEIVHKYFNPIK